MPFIFPRRYIQKSLNILRGVLAANQHTDLVSRLNRRSADRLPAMWEAVVLAFFTHLPDFEHETPLQNGRKPDFNFQLPETNRFVVGDITSVSDAGLKKANPIQQLMKDLGRVAKKFGGDISQFEVHVKSENVGEYRKRRVKLKLPNGNERQRFLNEELTPYIRERLTANDFGHKKIFSSREYEIEVAFKAKSQFSSYGHPSFTNTLHIDRNPIWERLKDKAKQLRGAPAGSFRLLVLCDGGCDTMHDQSLSSGVDCKQIVKEFLKRNTGLNAVVMMTVRDVRTPLQQFRKENYWELTVSETWLRSAPENQKTVEELTGILDKFKAMLPNPSSNAASATVNCLEMDYEIGAWGGYKMTSKKIAISARTLQQVLGGAVSIDEFNRAHGWKAGNPFASSLAKAETISALTIVRGDQDDDEVEFTFALDPAISPFR